MRSATMSWFSPNPPRHSSSHSHHDHKHYRNDDTRSQHSSSKDRGYFYTTPSSTRGTGRARSRSGYINRIISQIKRQLSRLLDYARRHPVKLLMMILPLLTGGALAGVLAKFGIRLPAGLNQMIGGGKGARHGGFGGSELGGMGGVDGLMKIAKMFI